ncbi:MAG: electron transport complex protein RnfA [Nitrospirota bacterium]
MKEIILLGISTALINNMVFSKSLGICPLLGVSKKLDSSIGMGGAVVFVVILASLTSWTIDRFFLYPLNLEYLRTIVYILVIASLVQLVEMVIHKNSPGLYKALGIYLPLITTNCMVLGTVLLIFQKDYAFFEMIAFSTGAGTGFAMAMVIMAGLREKLVFSKIPKVFQGASIALITISILSLAFLGFAGLIRG